MPGRSTADVIDAGARVRDAIGDRALLTINSDVDAAIALEADILHLAECAGTMVDARARVGGRMLTSRAVHGIEAAIAAEREGADFVLLGTVFASMSHPGGETIGIEGVRAVCDAVRVPVIVIGGITAENAASVMRAGAAGVAVISAIFDAEYPRQAAAALCDAMTTPARAS